MRILKNRSSESKSQVTCVRLSKDTRNRLAELGSKDQTFDDIINVTIDENLQKKQMCKDDLAQKMNDESEVKSS